ncbi:phosphoribosylformylglycinamidine synthase subunit PurS [Trichothermofontia sichuanensis B231]|uniref:phosphoribosylformylglycinamidine synthase subunit PurS n=1 Tax=Trichothermofontia sichuanensis TaxID=3045816 RepID=UPI0022450508|nr:phosphoribosylformylglycinamidine synthase subunit PurS [Trichothermofontia sichuanensis]UZQ54206.1 phosphoribosylformylglycinamidine synthase subunit PurS [Trichothermofontia sichuanensis B231]
MSAQTYQAQIYVTLRPSVLDPAGTAVQSGLHHLGYTGVTGVRIGKYIELTLEAESLEQAQQDLDRMCDQLLANPVIENYRFELHSGQPVGTAGGV